MTGRTDNTSRNPIQLPVEPLISNGKKEKAEEFNPEEINQLHAFQTQYKTTEKVHHVDAKRFALMLGDAFIENTKYEGGDPSVTYGYWKQLLNEMKEGKSNISNPLPQKQIDTVLTDLDNCLFADRLFNANGPVLGADGKAEQTKDMKELLAVIDKNLNSESHRFVLPLRYGEKGKSGHVFCAILEKNAQNQIICTILDKGEGSGMHRIVSLSNKQKRSYCFDPIQFRDPDIFKPDSEIGLALLQLLQKYRFPEPNSKANFKSKEIYDLLLQAGTLLDSPIALDEEIGVTSQRSGTCSEQVVRLLLRDGIYKLNPAREGTSIYKKVIFAGKFQILLDAYRSNIEPKVLKKGCEEFAVSVLKLKDAGLLSREEWIKSSALIDLVMTETASVLSKEPKVDLLPPLVRKIDPEKRFDFSALQEAPESMPGEQSKKIIDPPILFIAPTPETLLTYLKASAQRMEKSTSPLAAYCQAVHLIRSLPVPRVEDDPFWDKMPRDQIPEILGILNDLFELYIGMEPKVERTWERIKEKDYKDLMLTHISLFAVCDKLSRKLPDLHLRSYHFNIPIDKFVKPHHFQRGDDNVRFESIKKYVQGIDQRNSNVIFKIEKPSFDELTVYSFLNDPKDGTLQHLQFVSQFVSPKFGECSNEKFLELVLQHAQDTQHLLPPQVYRLRILAHKTQLMLDLSVHYADTIFETMDKEIIKSNRDTYPSEPPSIYSIKGDPEHPEDRKIHFNSEPNLFSWKTDLEPPESEKPLLSNRLGHLNSLFQFQIFMRESSDSENRIMIEKGADVPKDIPLHVYHDLKKIKIEPDLQISAIIRWANDHKLLLEEQKYRTIVEALLLQDTLFIEQLKKEPLLLESVRNMIKGQIQGLNAAENYQIALWWLRLGYHLETHAQVALSDTHFESLHKHYQNELGGLLVKVQKANETLPGQKEFQDFEKIIRLHKFYFAGGHETPNDEHIVTLVSNHLRLKYLDQKIPKELKWMEYEWHSIWEKHLHAIYEHVQKNPALISQFVELHLRELGFKSAVDDLSIKNWPFVEFKVDSNPFQLNLNDGVLFRSGAPIQQSLWPDKILNPVVVTRLFNRGYSSKPEKFLPVIIKALGSPLPKVLNVTSRFPGAENAVEAEDGSFRVIMKKDSYPTIQKKFVVNGKEQFYQYIREGDHYEGFQMPTILELSVKRAWARELTEKPSHYHMLICNKDGSLFAEGSFQPSKYDKQKVDGVLFRYNAKGEKEIFVDLTNMEAEINKDRWDPFLKSILNSDALHFNCFAWGTEKEGAYYLKTLEMVGFANLQFKILSGANGEPYLICDRFPEYQLSATQGLFGGHSFAGAVNLEKLGDPDKRGVLVRNSKLSTGQAIESEPMIKPDQFFDGEEPYFFYEIDEKTGKLHCQTQTGMLYLISCTLC